jgi:hypothetical protein
MADVIPGLRIANTGSIIFFHKACYFFAAVWFFLIFFKSESGIPKK